MTIHGDLSTQDLEVDEVSSGRNGIITTRKMDTTTIGDTTATTTTTQKVKVTV